MKDEAYISPEIIEKIAQEKAFLNIWAAIRYDDGFGESDNTLFCFKEFIPIKSWVAKV
jgi:hypothetical protein